MAGIQTMEPKHALNVQLASTVLLHQTVLFSVLKDKPLPVQVLIDALLVPLHSMLILPLNSALRFQVDILLSLRCSRKKSVSLVHIQLKALLLPRVVIGTAKKVQVIS